jgi:hypothetical protein
MHRRPYTIAFGNFSLLTGTKPVGILELIAKGSHARQRLRCCRRSTTRLPRALIDALGGVLPVQYVGLLGVVPEPNTAAAGPWRRRHAAPAPDPWAGGDLTRVSAALLGVMLAAVVAGTAWADAVSYVQVGSIGSPGPANQLIYSSSHDKLVLRNGGSAVRVIDLSDGSTQTFLSTSLFTDMSLSPSGRYVYVADYGYEDIGYGRPAPEPRRASRPRDRHLAEQGRRRRRRISRRGGR